MTTMTSGEHTKHLPYEIRRDISRRVPRINSLLIILFRDSGQHRLSVEARQQPRRFSRPRPELVDTGLPSLELTWDSQGEVVSSSPRKRGESMTTPRYMDWYIKQQHEQHEQLRQRQLDLQQQQEAARQRIKMKQRQEAPVGQANQV